MNKIKKLLYSLDEETFNDAKEFILKTLEDSGWEVRRMNPSLKPMKVPWAKPKSTGKDGEKLWFKSQAVWSGSNKPMGSTGFDHKEVADMIKKNKDAAVKKLLSWVS